MKLIYGTTAFSTISEAVQAIDRSYTIIIDFGVYEENVQVNCSSIYNIAIIGIGKPIIKGGIKITQASNQTVILKNLDIRKTISNPLDKSHAIEINGCCQNTLFDNLQVKLQADDDCYGNGMAIAFTSVNENEISAINKLTIVNSRIQGGYKNANKNSYDPAIIFQNKIQNSKIIDNIIKGGMYFNRGCTDVVIENNTIIANDSDVFSFGTSIAAVIRIVGNEIYSDNIGNVNDIIVLNDSSDSATTGKRGALNGNGLVNFIFTCNDVSYKGYLLTVKGGTQNIFAQKFFIKGNTLLSQKNNDYFNIAQGAGVAETFSVNFSASPYSTGGGTAPTGSIDLSNYVQTSVFNTAISTLTQNKLDRTDFSGVSGTFLTNGSLDSYAQKTYVDTSVSTKLDKNAYETASGSFLVNSDITGFVSNEDLTGYVGKQDFVNGMTVVAQNKSALSSVNEALFALKVNFNTADSKIQALSGILSGFQENMNSLQALVNQLSSQLENMN